jgi:hypothetical protein
MENDILHYRAGQAYNREIFLLQHADYFRAFDAIDKNFSALIEPLSTLRDGNGRTYVALMPFVFLLQRQSRAAFEAFSTYQSYVGWVLLRPGIESVLIIGKWIDDPENAKIWANRQEDRRSYQKTYSGQALYSKSLPASAAIRRALTKVNDDFVHANPEYYSRHLRTEQPDEKTVQFWLNYHDDEDLLDAHVLAFLHLMLVMQEALAGLIGAIFGQAIDLTARMAAFDHKFGKAIAALREKTPETAGILDQLGLMGSEA